MVLQKIKNTVSEMTYTPDGIFNRIDTTEKNDWTCGPTNGNIVRCSTERTKTRKNVENSSVRTHQAVSIV